MNEFNYFNLPRISVSIITYNQRDLIGRAIESVLRQKDYIYEIIICDDLSTDNTWEVINEYYSIYPELIRPYQNKENLGIFQNIERKWKLPKGDIIYDLSGDDEVGEDWFKKVIDFILISKIDYKHELFCVYGDSKCIYPNGDTFIFKNDAVNSGFGLLKLYERGLISNRSSCYSKNILKKFQKVSFGRSYIAENAQDAQLHIFTEKAYYIPHVGNLYYTNIGVSAHMDIQRQREYELTMVYAFNFFDRIGLNIDKYDCNLPKLNLAYKSFVRNRSLLSFIKVLKAYIVCFDPNLGFRDIKLKRIVFAFLRKIPHNRSIQW